MEKSASLFLNMRKNFITIFAKHAHFRELKKDGARSIM